MHQHLRVVESPQRKRPYSTSLRMVALVALLVFSGILAACGGNDDESNTPSPTTAAGNVDSSNLTAETGTAVSASPRATEAPGSMPTVADASGSVTPAVITAETPESTSAASAEPEATPTSATPTSGAAMGTGTAQVTLDGGTLSVPEDASIEVYASDLGEPRFMALAPDGAVLVTDRGGRVLRLTDRQNDGTAEATTLLDGLDNPHGITVHEQWLIVAEETRVARYQFNADATGLGEAEVLIDDLPSGGHWSRTVKVGPDGALYVSIGSSCNVCIEEDPRRATIQRYTLEGSEEEPFAVGLRNAVGIIFDEQGRLWATNNGRDGMGDDVPPETVNQANAGDDFGWPRCHAGTIADPEFVGETGCDTVTQPAVLMQAHSAPLGLALLTGANVPADWQDDLLVAFHGSWNRTEPTGYKVVRLPFDNGQPTGEVVDFVSGWLSADGDVWGRPVDLLVLPDGSLLISDDQEGLVYRLTAGE